MISTFTQHPCLIALISCASLIVNACDQQVLRHAISPPVSSRLETITGNPLQDHENPTQHTDHVAFISLSPPTIGIPACDAYLATYLTCHRAAHIFAAGQLQHQYKMMCNSLLRDSRDPGTRPQLASRCKSLALDLNRALHGKRCQPFSPDSGGLSDLRKDDSRHITHFQKKQKK